MHHLAIFESCDYTRNFFDKYISLFLGTSRKVIQQIKDYVFGKKSLPSNYKKMLLYC